MEGGLVQVHHAADSSVESSEFTKLSDTQLLLILLKGVKLCNLQLGDGLSLQWRQQPSGSEEAVLNNSQALQDVVAAREIQSRRFTGALEQEQTDDQPVSERSTC